MGRLEEVGVIEMRAASENPRDPVDTDATDPRVRSHAVVLGFLLIFACLTWAIPFGATFAVALVASFTLAKAPRWWRALVGCVAMTGMLFGLAYTAYLFIVH